MITDAAARDAIAGDLGVSMLVEAAAGTGKTTSLVTRIAELIRRDVCGVESLAAITFTVKAAAQLRERLHQALESCLMRTSGEERQRVAHAIDHLDRALIGTTHSFCARMLRERPVEAALDPDFRELDETETMLAMEGFWTRWFEAQAQSGSESLRLLREAGVRPAMLRSAFFRLVDYADVEIVRTPCEPPDLEGVTRAVLEFLTRCEPSLPDQRMREKPDVFEIMIRALIRKRDSFDLSDAQEMLDFLEEGNHVTKKATLKNWPDRDEAKRLYLDYSALAAALVRPTLVRWREYVHCLVIGFLEPAVAAFEAERMHDGTLTFNDLLLRARDLLRDHPAVRRYFQRRFTHILVDEFQDTDPIQAEVLFYLTGEDVEERNWRKLRPRAGSLFIVGDPKQSIYRFRRADITTYLTVKNLIETSGGRVVRLATNFRSTRPICDFVNATFPTLFTSADVAAGRQAEHVSLVARSDGAPWSGTYVLETQDARQEAVATEEARCIAKWIRNAVESRLLIDDGGAQRPAQYGDFLLVSERKQRLPLYAQALEAEGLRYEMTGGEAFAQSEDLGSVMPLLRAVADPDDGMALAAFLRGPLCGASDEALYRFVRAGGTFSAIRTAPQEIDPAVAAGLRMVREGIETVRAVPPAAAIARMFEAAGVSPLAASADRGGTRAGNLLLALSLARRQSAAGAGFGEVVEWMGELLASKAKIEELDVDPAAANVVRLMNLHQVKGLEAPVVFLIDPIDDRPIPPDLYVDRSGDVSRGYVAIRERKNFATNDLALPQGWDALVNEEVAFRQAERKRLLYVAATRAKSILVAGVRVKNGERAGIWSSLARGVKTLFAHEETPAAEAATPPSGGRFEEARAAIRRRMETARETSYSVLPITKVAHASHMELVRAEEGLGKGTSWGRVLHRLFEALLRNDALNVLLYAENLLKDEERDPVEVSEVVAVVESLRASPLWGRVKAADESHAEVPFALVVPRREAGLDEDGETLLHGVVDLVFREGDCWHIVDYKSDSTAGRLDALVRYYSPQVELYARFWAKLTQKETKAALFFADGSIERWVR